MSAKPKQYQFKLGTGKFTVAGQPFTITRRVAPVAQAVKFFTGFESGNVLELANGSLQTSVTFDTTTKRTGGYALKHAGATAQLICQTIGGTQMAMRFAFRFDATLAADTVIMFEQGTSGSNRLEVILTTADKLKLADGGVTMGLTATTGSTVLSANTWYIVDVQCDLAASGVVKLQINGVSELSLTHSSNVSATVFNRILLGGSNNANAFHYDDFRVDTGGVTAIGAGQIIARQGLNSASTTPTYTAWTKTGGSSSGANWSETPFSATNNCNSATLNNAQTMVVDPFNTDPSRSVEGTQVIGTGDTINACKVGGIFKTSSNSKPMSIRYRANSADTDTTVTLTPANTDQWFENTYFTDTLAHLDACEIGVKQGSNGITETAEDMWLMVDYTPATTVQYTFTFDVGAFTLTGKALTLPVSRPFALGVGSFTLTGEPISFLKNFKAFALGVGTFVVTGEPTTRAISLALGAGSFILTGFSLSRGAQYICNLGAGAFAVTGQALTMKLARAFSLGKGTFTLTGQSLAFKANRLFSLGAGAFAVAGQAISVIYLALQRRLVSGTSTVDVPGLWKDRQKPDRLYSVRGVLYSVLGRRSKPPTGE